MKHLIEIKYLKGMLESSMLINEDQVCSIERVEGETDQVVLTMSNGLKYHCVSPTYGEWENDLILQRTEG